MTSVAVLVVATAGYALLMKYDGNIGRIAGVLDLPGEGRPTGGNEESRTLLLVGSDSREGLEAGQGSQGRGDEFVTGQRADTIILAHLFADSEQAQLVSIPRDTYVTVPEFRDPATGSTVEEHEGKINSSFFDGGAPLLVATVERFTGVRVDHYVQIDFNGFQTMVDTLGGVEVCLSEPAFDRDSGIDLPAGRQVVEGDQALAFVRQRKGLPRGDIDRIRRQQQFMGAVIRKTLSAGTLLNPLRLNGFLDAVTDSLQVDEGTDIADLRDLALRMRGASAGQVTFSTVPVADPSARRGGESVVLVDEVAAETLFDRLRRDLAPGEPDPRESAEPEPLTVPPSEVSVRVLNGAGISGLGRQAAAELEERGFVITEPPSDRGREAVRSTVLHGPGQEEAARTLAAAVPGAEVELDPSLDDTVELVVGALSADFGAEAPAPGPSASPNGEPALTAADDLCAP